MTDEHRPGPGCARDCPACLAPEPDDDLARDRLSSVALLVALIVVLSVAAWWGS